MKLSMWMIANRLAPILDIQTDISPDAKPILKSARLVYSTDCVHVYEKDDCIVYYGEGDIIRIYNITLKEAFEILQGVFDYFQDWEETIQQHLLSSDFQAVIDESWILFQNPMIIMDANNRRLGMTSREDLGTMDEEWNYLKTYGYSSLNSIDLMNSSPNSQLMNFGIRRFELQPNALISYGGISYALQFNDIYCGRITLLQKNREINPGDYQILEKLAFYLTPRIVSPSSGGTSIDANVFYDLLFSRHYDEKELDRQLSYHKMKSTDTYQIAVLFPKAQNNLHHALQLVYNTVSQQFGHLILLKKSPYVILMSNHILSGDTLFLEFLEQLRGRNLLDAGFSLPTSGPRTAANMFKQALNAIEYGRQLSPEKGIYQFYNYSLNYMLDTPYIADRIQACHPVIRKLWTAKNTSSDDLYDTLKVYLDNERSLNKTAALLFTHRNTILYRIKKCQEMLGDTLDDSVVRYYIRISMYFLEDAASNAKQPNHHPLIQ